MKPLSKAGREMVRWLQLSPDHEEVKALLNELGDRLEPAVLPAIQTFLLVDAQDVAKTAAAAAQRLLATVRVADLPWLDQQLRSESYDVRAFKNIWKMLRPLDLDWFESHGEASFTLLALASCHRSGFVRETALGRLTYLQDGWELPFLLIRLNDWVQSVADLAQWAVAGRLHAGYAPHLVANLPLILRLQGQDLRRWAGPLVETVRELLRKEGEAALLAGLAPDRDRTVRRACTSLIFGPSASPEIPALESGLADRDPFIRLQAARWLSTLPAGAKEPLLQAALRDPFMPVRIEAFEERLRSTGDLAVAYIEPALLDPYPAIRHIARRALADRGVQDFAGFYRLQIPRLEGRALAAALAGLGETGRPADTAAVEPFLHHPLSRVRAAAVRVLGKLDAKNHLAKFLETIRTDRGRPLNEALTVLTENVFHLPLGQIWNTLMAAEHGTAKVACLKLISHLSKWDSLPYLLAAATSVNAEVAAAARAYVGRWLYRFNRSFTQPSADQMRKIELALQEAEGSLDRQTLQQIGFLIQRGW